MTHVEDGIASRKADPVVLALVSTLSLSLISLGVAGLALILAFTSTEDSRNVDDRLACLELPGPNDCGLDGR